MKSKQRNTLMIVLMCCVNFLTAQLEPQKDSDLIKTLEEVLKTDQEGRERLITILEKNGKDSEEFKNYNEQLKKRDSLNMLVVAKILDTRGWLGEDVIGKQASIALFLVVQHADLKTQKKYLPMLEDAVKQGNAMPNTLAMLQDRVAMLDGQKQFYGSQLTTDEDTGALYVHPIADPKNVDERRAKVGLGKIADYLSIYGLKWNLKEHEKEVLRFEKQNGL